MIIACTPATAKRDFLMGVHARGDAYMLALYSANADLNFTTEFYTTRDEVKGRGYQPGGRPMVGYTCQAVGANAFLSWEGDIVWPVATITARGGLVYNASKDNRVVRVLDFGEDVRSTNGPFKVPFPKASMETAMVRLL